MGRDVVGGWFLLIFVFILVVGSRLGRVRLAWKGFVVDL